MARKRMIDPNIWESAFEKGWTSEEFSVMVAAISVADDEGRGKVAAIKRCIKSMMNDKKFEKTLQKLTDPILFYENSGEKLYFLKNWKNYQTINRPSPSRLPQPNIINNNKLVSEIHGAITERSLSDHTPINEGSLPSKVKVREVNLKEVKSKESEDQTPYSFETSSSYLFTPKNYDDDDQLKAVLILMLARFCKENSPDKATVTRFFNIITATQGVTRKTAHRIALETFQKFKEFEEKKRNLPYLSVAIEGKINDAIIKARETRAKNNKENHLLENQKLLDNISSDEGLDDLNTTFRETIEDFNKNHRV